VRLVQELRPHRAAVVPAMLALLMAQPLEDFDLSSLRFIGSGGAPLSLELAQALEARLPGVTVSEGYGMTESSALLTSQSPSERRAGTVGRAVPGVEVRIVDVETGEVLPAGREGEIVARGASLMAGYWHDPDATARTVVDGWLHTGDVGVLDDDGYLRVVDRLKDLVIRGGFNVYPRDVEDALLEHPDVILAGVVGRPDPVLGEEVVAFVSLCEGAGRGGMGAGAGGRAQAPAGGARARRHPAHVGGQARPQDVARALDPAAGVMPGSRRRRWLLLPAAYAAAWLPGRPGGRGGGCGCSVRPPMGRG